MVHFPLEAVAARGQLVAMRRILSRALKLALGAAIVAAPLRNADVYLNALLLRLGLTQTPLIAHLETPSDTLNAMFVLAAGISGLLAAAVWCSDQKEKGARLSAPWIIAFGLQAAVIVISILLISPDPAYALSQALLPVAAIIFFFSLICALRRMSDLYWYCQLWVLLGVALGLIAIVQSFGFGVTDAATGKMKAVSLFGHPNHLASALVPIFFLALALPRSRPIRESKAKTAGAIRGWFRGISIFILGLSLLSTGTRGAWLAVLTGLVIYGYLLLRARLIERPHLVKGALALVLLLAGLAFLTLHNPFMAPRLNLRERLGSSAEIRSRLYSWLIACDMARALPLTGLGIGGYSANFWEYVARRQATPSGTWFESTVILMNGVTPEHAHNEYLNLAAEQGAPGLFAFLLIVSCGLTAAWRLGLSSSAAIRGLAAALGAGVIACLVDACFMFPFHLAVSLAAFLFLLVCLARMAPIPPKI
ncbi:MAG: O-antigen ligase family protein [Candidatus Sumerlaeota bacterium]|nr:O-antigen ligase family protein [Candidatus Sumerlaeota bacterium]